MYIYIYMYNTYIYMSIYVTFPRSAVSSSETPSHSVESSVN